METCWEWAWTHTRSLAALAHNNPQHHLDKGMMAYLGYTSFWCVLFNFSPTAFLYSVVLCSTPFRTSVATSITSWQSSASGAR